MYYSKSTGGFYLSEIHGENIPADSVEITEEDHAALMQGQTDGMLITADDNGYPVLTERPAPSPAELAQQAAHKRTSLISEASAIIAPLADAKAGGYIDDGDIPRLEQWQRYRYELTKVDPENPAWPDQPTV